MSEAAVSEIPVVFGVDVEPDGRPTLGQPLHRPLTLYRQWRSAEAYWDMIEGVLEELPVPYITLVIRSDLPLQQQMAQTRAILEALLGRGHLVRRMRFTDAVDAIDGLRPVAFAQRLEAGRPQAG